MQTYNGLFEKELTKLLNERIEYYKDILSNGNIELSFEHTAGIIKGLRQAINGCVEVSTKLANT